MGYGHTFEGRSGRYYSYALVGTKAADCLLLPWQGGCYIFAKNATAPIPVNVGECHSFRGSLGNAQLWGAAQSQHDANLLYIHAMGDERTRQAELIDLVSKYDPPMNREK